MSEQELSALVQILNRVPVSLAEQLWLQELVRRLQEQLRAAHGTPNG